MRRLPLSFFALLWAGNVAMAEGQAERLDACLEPGEKKTVCAAYLRDLMRDVRFGTPIREPFCLPKRDLTAEESNLVYAKFLAENPKLDPLMAATLAGVITIKAARCP
jgi:hypothetical protein